MDEQITSAEIENEVERIYDFKTTGAQIRSRVQLLEEGEQKSKYFMNLEKSRQNGKVDNIFEKGNNKITNNELILTEIN